MEFACKLGRFSSLSDVLGVQMVEDIIRQVLPTAKAGSPHSRRLQYFESVTLKSRRCCQRVGLSERDLDNRQGRISC